MAISSKKVLSLFCFVSICSLHADYSGAQQERGEITPLAGPVVKNWAEFNVSADFIYWQAREDYLYFATDGARTPTGQGQLYDFDFKYAPGFQVALGLDFKHDGWDLLLGYTWLRENNVTAEVSYNPKQGPLDDISLYYFPGRPTDNTVRAFWQLHFNAIDWDLGRHFYVSRFLALRPFIGIKGAWINQNFNCLGRATVYTENDSFNNTVQSQEFWGAGLRGGLNSEWHFTRNWSLYGVLGLDALYGQFQDTVLSFQSIDSQTTLKQSQRCNLHTISPILEFALGVRYETFFSNDRYQLFAQAGWDQQVWFNQTHFIVGLASGSGQISGNLVLQGLNVKFGFSF